MSKSRVIALPNEILQRAWRKLDFHSDPAGLLRVTLWRLRGAQIGCGTRLPPRTEVTWPHQVKLGRRCILQSGVFFNYDHYWTPGPSIVLGDRVFVGRGVEFNIRGGIKVGDDVLIASGCVFIDHDHGIVGGLPIKGQPIVTQPIQIEEGAWIGACAVVLKGVTIGKGAVVAAGAVVSKPIPAGEIWAGVPATRIRCRAALP